MILYFAFLHIHIFISIESLSNKLTALTLSPCYCIYLFIAKHLLSPLFIGIWLFLKWKAVVKLYFLFLFLCFSCTFLHFLHIISFRFISIIVVFAWRASSIIDPSYLVSNFFHHILCIVYIAFFANHLLSLSIFFLCFFIALFFLHFIAHFFFLQNTFSLFLYIWLLFVCCTSFSCFCFFCTTCLFTFYIFLFIFVSVSIC